MKEKVLKKKGILESDRLIDGLVALQIAMEKLPELSDVDKAKLNQEIALGHLYYSSKIEGTHLTHKQIENAVHGKETAAA